MALRHAAPVLMAALLTGCGSIGAISIPGVSRGDRPPPPPTAAAPAPPVETAALPPPGQTIQQQTLQTQTQQDPYLPQASTPPSSGGFMQSGQTSSGGLQPLPQQTSQQQPTQQAALQPQQAAGSGVGRTDLLGGWTISSAGDSCQLFMTLTSWRGGYRASTRGCSNATLKGISAWDLQGTQVVLSGQTGDPVARLYASGGNRFDGQAEGGGGSVSFFR